MTDQFEQAVWRVPPTRADERRSRVIPDHRATARDIRWYRQFTPRSVVAILLLAWLALSRLNTAFLDRDTWWIDLLIALVAGWWLTGAWGALEHSVRMGARMADVVDNGLATWRHLPEPLRSRAAPVAAALVRSGVRHDREGVRVRIEVLRRAVVAGMFAVPLPRLDVDDLDAWITAAEETHRD